VLWRVRETVLKKRYRLIGAAPRLVALTVLAILILARAECPAAQPEAAPVVPRTSDIDPKDDGNRKPGKPAPPSSFPRLSDGRVDFTGIWFTGYHGVGDARNRVALTPEYDAVLQKRQLAAADGRPYPDYSSICAGFGMPRIMVFATLEFISKPTEMWVISEFMHEVRRIFIDGKPHGKYVDRDFDGVSVGHWEGDVLVVHTDKIREGYFDAGGAPHSDRLVIDERFRMINKDSMEDVMTLTDPVALTRPFTFTNYYDRRLPDYEITEYVCAENLRSGIGAAQLGRDLNDPDNDPGHMLPKSAISADR